MEPVDPHKNDENTGCTRRRLSSILKAPRKSARFPDTEQQEKTVECAKPVDKRNSRRVSFAPANDVLLFSKEVKNASPVRSPLQDLMTTTTAQNRVQITENGNQQILGMETLLNAPLHASQQWEKVGCDSGEKFGEKTLMFVDDAFMDLTHSHTINIGNDSVLPEDLPHQKKAAGGEKTLVFAGDDASMDMTLSRTVNLSCAPVPDFDAGFTDFLASLSKSSANHAIPRAPPAAAAGGRNSCQIKTPKRDGDKENLVPSSSLLEKSINKTWSLGEPVQGSAPEDNAEMDDDDDDPFQCLFPTQEMYSQSGKAAATKTPQQPSKKTQGYSDNKAAASGVRSQAAITQEGARLKSDATALKNSSLHVYHHGHKDDLKDSEKTVRFTADDACMDMTQSHTVNIAKADILRSASTADFFASSLKPRQVEPLRPAESSVDPGFQNFLAGLSKKPNRASPAALPVFPAGDHNMDMTEAQTGRTVAGEPPCPLPTQEVSTHGRKLKIEERPSGLTDIETSMKPSLKTKEQSQIRFADSDGSEKTVRFTADDALMEVTRCHTVNIAAHLDPPAHPSRDPAAARGDTTVRFADIGMDMTGCLTVNIDSVLPAKRREELPQEEQADAVLTRGRKVSMDATETQTGRVRGLVGAGDAPRFLFPTPDRQGGLSLGQKGLQTALKASSNTRVQTHQVGTDDDYREKTVRFSADDACMDVTRSHTVNIAAHFEPQSLKNLEVLPAGGEKTVRFSADDACMDVTKSHTVNIATHFEPQSLKNVEVLPVGGEKTVRFSADDACMDVTRSHTVNIAAHFEPQSIKNVEVLPLGGEKTVRFSADDACMDVTRSHTVNIAAHFEPQPLKNVEVLPAGGEKTVRFSADNACMDVTRSHTVNIATDFEGQSLKNMEMLPSGGEKTVRFSADDAAMDVTRSHTVNIATSLEGQSENIEVLPPGGEKTLRFSAQDAAMDVTRSLTVDIATHFDPHSHQDLELLPRGGERTVRFSADDATMDVTRCHTVNISTHFEPEESKNVAQASPTEEKTQRFTANDAEMDMTQCLTANISNNLLSDSVHVQQDSQVSPTCGKTRRSRSSACALDPGPERASGPWVNHVIPSAVASTENFEEPVETNSFVAPLESQRADVESEALAAMTGDKSVNNEGGELSMDMTEAQTGQLLRETSMALPSERETSPRSSEAPGTSNHDGVEVTGAPGSPETKRESQTSPQGEGGELAPTRKSRRKSLADLQSKLRRLSHMVSADPEPAVVEAFTTPLPLLDHENHKDPSRLLPTAEPDPETGLGNAEDDAQPRCPPLEEPSVAATTPFKLKTKELMSRLSVGGFKPKLPQRNKTPKKGEDTRTAAANAGVELGGPDHDVSDINDEELGSCEDLSLTLDTRSPRRAAEKASPPFHFHVDESLQRQMFEEELLGAAQGKKRPLPEDEVNMEDEKRMKQSADPQEDVEDMGSHSQLIGDECDGNITAAPSTHSIDSSNNTHTASSRCEATFESTFKQSLFESQLEDATSHMQMTLEDSTITVSEFFKVFNIDFVIHNPRQSILPGRPLADSDRTPLDLLKDKHLVRPKQLIYEADVQQLTEEVEGLKLRMRDLDKPLKMVNRALWEEMKKASDKELKSFGAKLKERNHLFRKTSKAQSHGMKQLLYSNLLQANMEEQQKLKGSIQEADEMINTLDGCISQLEAELSAVEEKGSDNKQSLKSCQQGLMKVTDTLDDNNRQISEMEMLKTQNCSKLKRLKSETRNLEKHIDLLNTVNEWRFREKTDSSIVYSFLHDTLHLQLLYENVHETGADSESERKISHITFSHQLHAEKSRGHAHLVHQLLSQYVEGEGDWVQRYPTSSHVPKLLHDVSLVVSCCRSLGEELRLLEMWGGLRLDIVDISCDDMLIQILFSSLKTLSKFEVVFSVGLISCLCVLRVHSFKNIIGTTTIQQIEEIVAAFSPAKKLLTRIVKKIHDNLLS